MENIKDNFKFSQEGTSLYVHTEMRLQKAQRNYKNPRAASQTKGLMLTVNLCGPGEEELHGSST